MKSCRVIGAFILLIIFKPLFASSLQTQEWDTSNGAHVVFYQALEVPMLDIIVAFAAGSAYDGSKLGLSALTTSLLDQGNGGLNAGLIADKFAEVGAQFANANTKDMMMLSLRTLTEPKALKQATDLFALIINHPDFPKDAFAREKNQQLMLIKQSNESADMVAEETFYSALYKQHPYAHPTMGRYNTVEGLTRDDILQFYRQYVVSKNAVIVLVGAIDNASAHTLAELITKDLPQGSPPSPIPHAHSLTNELNIEVQQPTSQTAIRLGQLGITHQDNDYFALQVGSYILGGRSLGSRLGFELREKRGLTYGVNSTFLPMPGIGPFIVAFSTQHPQAKLAIDVTRNTLDSFIQTGPDEQELIAAKQYLTGSFPMSLASNRHIANMLLRLTFYHLPKDFLTTYIHHINAVSLDDIKQAFQRHVKTNQLVQITVGRT